jgi:hypothetical protein
MPSTTILRGKESLAVTPAHTLPDDLPPTLTTLAGMKLSTPVALQHLPAGTKLFKDMLPSEAPSQHTLQSPPGNAVLDAGLSPVAPNLTVAMTPFLVSATLPIKLVSALIPTPFFPKPPTFCDCSTSNCRKDCACQMGCSTLCHHGFSCANKGSKLATTKSSTGHKSSGSKPTIAACPGLGCDLCLDPNCICIGPSHLVSADDKVRKPLPWYVTLFLGPDHNVFFGAIVAWAQALAYKASSPQSCHGINVGRSMEPRGRQLFFQQFLTTSKGLHGYCGVQARLWRLLQKIPAQVELLLP